MMKEVNIKAPSTPNTKAVALISIEDPRATMKPIHAKTPAHHVPREVRAATTTKRLINPLLVTFATTSTPA